MIEITNLQARRFLLSYQGLAHTRRVANIDRIVEFVHSVGCIQYDPLSIVARNADLVLQSRFSRYDESLLERTLYESRRLIDGWDKVASILPAESWPFFKRYRESQVTTFSEIDKLAEVRSQILKRLESGVLSSNELRLDKKIDWFWGPADLGRAALQAMFHAGDLLIHHRVGTRKYYALSESILPAGVFEAAEPHPSDDDYIDWRVLRRVSAVGLLPARNSDAWQIHGVNAALRKRSIARLVERGLLIPIGVEQLKEPFYAVSSERDSILRERPKPRRNMARLIAPLDNVMWDRRLISDLFHFEYTWEVYTPPAKRRYGYYVLPVLLGDRFVARCEPVVDRRSKTLEIKGWWWESDSSVKSSGRDDLDAAVAKGLLDFAEFCRSERIVCSGSASFLKDLVTDAAYR